ncbi:hypothetical protein EFK50_19930 [Nocardioides marmoriginsengisoli]|uniref:CU044_5270 family protein n=1 Tax=Nocardioides marmoriginsengisoli TaxID=661483 RepID=A0A3N0CAU8_9ACTN|nr:CU044_5270 family protein [Nocardioides marmoriginsengisoli]RNL60587.1 hypothetical protein EFK50_19930 [Nocardioides marmoriginsengisoli]
MSNLRPNDDPELRKLLDSIGLHENVVPESDPESTARAQAMLGRILEQPRGRGQGRRFVRPDLRLRVGGRRTVLGLLAAGVACAVIAIALVVVEPGAGPRPAAAETPPMLTFSGVDGDHLPGAGAPARALLENLAGRAEGQPPAADLPVQRVVLDAWWSSTDPADRDRGPATVLVPRHVEVYQLPDGTRRSIERRGRPLDADGRATDQPGSWSAVPSTTDETFTNDLGADYPGTLPESVPALRKLLAPPYGCGGVAGGCLLGAVNDLFTGYVVAPSVTARLWRLLATEPTITTLGTTKDRLGRDAVVLVADATDPTQRTLVLIDPDTGRYLGSESILVKPNKDLGFKPPAVVAFTALASADRVEQGEVPDSRTTTRY